jgi:peptidoglycan/LPS O-acetylase OafA/YrhL
LSAIPKVLPRRGDPLAIAGFALVTVLSIFPWSRFGQSSDFMGAWSLHWSLVAVTAGALGLAFAVYVSRRPIDQAVEASVYAGLAVVVAVAALLHHRHPPPLTVGTASPWLAVVGAILSLAGATVKGVTVLRASRGLP